MTRSSPEQYPAPLTSEETSGAILVTTIVDNAGVSRAKAVPARRSAAIAASGLGLSRTLGVYSADDHVTTSPDVPGPSGDLRLRPDLAAASPLAYQPGWSWAPADQHTLDGHPYAGCQRGFLRRMETALGNGGLTMTASVEVEWYLEPVSAADSDAERYTTAAYGLDTLDAVADLVTDLLDVLARSAIDVEQIHAEYGRGQMEISISPTTPVAAADRNVLVRQCIRSVSRRHGYRASFSPMYRTDRLGTGAHVHLSLDRNGVPLFCGGPGRHGLFPEAEAFLAGIIRELPALTALIAGSPVSHLRLAPSMWAGAYAAWGLENREAAVRLIGPTGDPTSANAEVKTVDSSANPYLAVGSLIAAGLTGIEHALCLPAETHGDPALDTSRAVTRLPAAQRETLVALGGSAGLCAALGDTLLGNIVAVRTDEIERHADADADALLDLHRWCY